MKTTQRGILLLFMVWAQVMHAAMSPEEMVSAAERETKAGAIEKAIDLYLGFIKDNPAHVQRPLVHYRLALCYDSIGKADAAEQSLKDSLAAPAERESAKYRPDAYMRLSRLYADANKHKEAAETLNALLKEGAGLYEEEAQNLRAGYLAILEQYDEAAVLFDLLSNKPNANIAKEAAYKLAIVWLKAEKLDLARNAIEAYTQRYTGDARISELFMRLARAYYAKKQYKSAEEVCQQVLGEFKDTPEAVEAAFVIGLLYRENQKPDKAIEYFLRATRMPQAVHNAVLKCEALFEIAQLYRKQLKQPDKAANSYHEAAILARDPITERQQQIQEQSLFFEAEIYFQQQKWNVAFDLYAQLYKLGSKLNLAERMMYCKSKINPTGDTSVDINSEAELEVLRKRITDNPGTLMALQGEISLVEAKIARAQTAAARQNAWSVMEPFVKEYAALLRRYSEDLLKQQNLGAFIKLRQAALYRYLTSEHPNYGNLSTNGLELCEQALAEAPEALFRVEALENLAILAGRCGQKQKELETYKKLYAITGKDPTAAVGRKPSEYLIGILSAAENPDLANEAAKVMDGVISALGDTSEDVRSARFYRAELLFTKQRYAQAAAEFKDFVKRYGPPQNPDGSVSSAWKRPAKTDPQLDQVYEAALREAHCWRSQHSRTNTLAAYQWIVANLNYQNHRVAEAWYTILTTGVDPAKLSPTDKENLARQLWTRIVNNSLDTGSKAFRSGYYPWVHNPDALPFVKAAVLRTGEYFGDVGKHRLAGDIFREYTTMFSPFERKTKKDEKQPTPPPDDQYEIASYAAGKEYLLANEYKLMVEQFLVFMDDLRLSRFRIPALMALGHYGPQADMFPEAIAAYCALLDEYGPANPVDASGWPIRVAVEHRMRKEGSWNGFRFQPPPKWDKGQIRFGLGFLYWKKEEWAACQSVLTPFQIDTELRKSPSRADALLMIARCYIKQNLPSKAMRVFETIARDHADFKAIEEVYTELARMAIDAGSWSVVSEACKNFTAKFPNSERLPYMNLFTAIAQAESGNMEAGTATLRQLAKAETYEDIKASAYYQLAMFSMRQENRDLDETLGLLRKSIACYPEPRALMQTAKCAAELKYWTIAQDCLEQFARDFPTADRRLKEDAQDLQKRVTQGLNKR